MTQWHDIASLRGWRYRNTFMLVLSIVVLVLVLQSAQVRDWLDGLYQYGYIGAFVAGIFFVSTFTVAPAGVVLFSLGAHLHPILLAFTAGIGAVVGDYLILRFFKDKVYEEVRPLFARFRGSYIEGIFKTPYFAWLIPVIGAAVIASPLPDEIGVGLLGSSKLPTWQFVVLTFTLNTLGILIIVSASRAIA